jgi:hypothetical protein
MNLHDISFFIELPRNEEGYIEEKKKALSRISNVLDEFREDRIDEDGSWPIKVIVTEKIDRGE